MHKHKSILQSSIKQHMNRSYIWTISYLKHCCKAFVLALVVNARYHLLHFPCYIKMHTVYLIPLPRFSVYSSVRLFFDGLEDLWYNDLSGGSGSKQSDFLFIDINSPYLQILKTILITAHC